MFQPMPPLSADALDALRADIAARGVLVPIVVDQHGRVLDGHNRHAIAADLGIDCPREVREVSDDDGAMDLAVTLNCARRHLNREERRVLVAAEIVRRPGDSDRAIARRVGCSPSTVAAVRRPVSKLDTPTPASPRPLTEAEAAQMTDAIRESAEEARGKLRDVCILALMGGATRRDTLAALLEGNAAEATRFHAAGPEVVATMQTIVFTPVVQWLTDNDDAAIMVAAITERADVEPMPPDILQLVLDQLAGRTPAWLAEERGLSAWMAAHWGGAR